MANPAEWGATPIGESQTDPRAWGAIPHPSFGSDEYISALAKKHGADPKFVRHLAESAAGTQFVKGIPIAGAYAEKAGAGLSALANPLTGAGAPGETVSERYAKNLPLQQELAQDFEREHPIASTATQMLGGVAATGGLGASGVAGRTLLGMVGRNAFERAGAGALSGASINAADALARGGDLGTVGTGAGIGGLLGGGVPIVAGALSRPVQGLIQTVRGAVNPAEQATRNVATALERDAQLRGVMPPPPGAQPNPRAGMTEAEFQAAQAHGAPVNLMDMGGETTRGLARSAANTSPEGRQVLSQPIDARFESQAPRTGTWFNSTLHYPTEAARNQAIRDVAENVYQPAYYDAYRTGNRTLLWPDRDLMQSQDILNGSGAIVPGQQATFHALNNLQRVAQEPEVQQAARIATLNLRNWAFLDWQRARAQGLTSTSGPRVPDGAFQIAPGAPGHPPQTVLNMTGGASPSPVLPSVQYWDYVKRALDQMGTPTSRQYSRILRNNLDQLVPEYATARAAAQPTHFFDGASNAYEAGGNFFNSGDRFGVDARRHIGNMTDQEQRLFQDGYATSLIEKIERSPDRRNIVNNLANSTESRREIETALGHTRLNQIQVRMHVENIMEQARGAVQGNSTTARQLSELGLAGGTGLLMSGGNPNPMSWDPATMISAALAYGARRTGNTINANVSRQVAEMLASNDLGRVRTGMRMIAGNPQMRDALRIADQSVSRSAAVQLTPGPDQSQRVH